MPKNGTEFSRYATTFHEIIDGKKSKIAMFTKNLLKMGLVPDDKDTINDLFPTLENDVGKSFIEEPKAGLLRKYYNGTNDLTNLLPQLETEFDSEFIARYSEELQDYDDSKLIEFANSYQLIVDEDDIDYVTEAIAELYVSIIKNVSNKKREKTSNLEVNPKSDKDIIVLSYTFTEPEKQALVRLCELLQPALRRVKNQTDTIDKKRYELSKLTDTEEDKAWEPHLESEIASYIRNYDKDFSKIEELCSELVELLEPKQGMNEDFPILISFANNIGNDEYRITCSYKFKYNPFKLMISDFNDCIERTLRFIDKL